MLDHRERLEWRVEATKRLPSTAPEGWDARARGAALHGHLPWMYHVHGCGDARCDGEYFRRVRTTGKHRARVNDETADGDAVHDAFYTYRARAVLSRPRG